MTQCPLKDHQPLEPSLPDWLAFLKSQPADEDPFHVKGPKLLPLVDKKVPHVITGTHRHGNLKYIGKTSQNLVQDLSPSNPAIGVEEPSTSKVIDGKGTSHKDSDSGTWSMWLIMLVVLWIFSLLLPKPSPQEWNGSFLPSLSLHSLPASSIHWKTMNRSTTATSSSANVPIPKRIATIILQELSPFPSPLDPDMTPLIDSPWKSEGMETTESPLMDEIDSRGPIEWKPIVEELTIHVQELDESHLDQSNMHICNHSWQWILHRSCRVQRRKQEGTNTTQASTITTPTTSDVSPMEPCNNWMSRDCRVQKRALTRSRSNGGGSSARKSADGKFVESTSGNDPTEPMFKEQTVKAVQSLLEAAYQTHKLMNLWIQEELQTTYSVELRNIKDS